MENLIGNQTKGNGWQRVTDRRKKIKRIEWSKEHLWYYSIINSTTFNQKAEPMCQN